MMNYSKLLYVYLDDSVWYGLTESEKSDYCTQLADAMNEKCHSYNILGRKRDCRLYFYDSSGSLSGTAVRGRAGECDPAISRILRGITESTSVPCHCSHQFIQAEFRFSSTPCSRSLLLRSECSTSLEYRWATSTKSRKSRVPPFSSDSLGQFPYEKGTYNSQFHFTVRIPMIDSPAKIDR